MNIAYKAYVSLNYKIEHSENIKYSIYFSLRPTTHV